MGRTAEPVMKMTEEQKNLLVDNIGLFYKGCNHYNIYDEDDRQTILLQVCKGMKSFNPENGALSTFIYTIIYHEKIRLWEQKKKQLETTAVSLDAPVGYSDDGDDMTWADMCGEEDETFQLIESREAYKQILQSYKKKYPETWERDINVFKAVVNKMEKIKIAKTYHVPYGAISPTFIRVSNYFRKKIAVV